MRFDDRLSTVLSQPVATPHDRIVRWRQLVDLVARSGGEGDLATLQEAIRIIEQDRKQVRQPLRAAAARAIAGSPVPLALLRVFAADVLAVAAPLLAGADLDERALESLRDVASPDVMSLLARAPAAADNAAPSDPVPSISDVVARIERLRTERAMTAPEPPPAEAVEAPVIERAPPAPAAAPTPRRTKRAKAGAASAFRWECNPSGEIDWVEGAPRGPLIGRSIAGADPDEGVDDCVERAFRTRAPFRNCMLEIGGGGDVSGSWTISGAPAFAQGDGRFIGYRGMATRGRPSDQDVPTVSEPSSSYDSVREMIHEIKTPLNAIIGFAEIIDGQYFGPAHRRYRQRAAQIVTNARLLLLAAEDLDFVARTRSAPAADRAPAWLSDAASEIGETIVARAVRQGVLIEMDDAIPGGGGVRIDAELAERLALRLADALASSASAGERLPARMELRIGNFILSLKRPASIAHMSSDQLLDPEFTVGGGDETALPLGFNLRLINGLAGLAGGRLDFEAGSAALILPTLTE